MNHTVYMFFLCTNGFHDRALKDFATVEAVAARHPWFKEFRNRQCSCLKKKKLKKTYLRTHTIKMTSEQTTNFYSTRELKFSLIFDVIYKVLGKCFLVREYGECIWNKSNRNKNYMWLVSEQFSAFFDCISRQKA